MTGLLKKRTNYLFGFLCCFIPLNFIISFFLAIFMINPLIDRDSHFFNFYLSFLIPQLLYPIGCALLMFIASKLLHFEMQDLLSREKTKVIDYIAYIFLFLGLSNILSILTDLVLKALASVGIEAITFEGLVPEPNGAFEIILLVLAIAILPGICEEFVYRFTVCGILSNHNKVGAIIVSSIAFSMSHATLEQIPYAFVLGLVLGLIYLKTNNYRVTILVHFVNNLVATLSVILAPYLDENTYNNVFDIVAIVIYVMALLSAIYLIFKYKKDLFSIGSSNMEHKEFAMSVVKSPFFWLFILLFIGLTVYQQVSYSLMQNLNL